VRIGAYAWVVWFLSNGTLTGKLTNAAGMFARNLAETDWHDTLAGATSARAFLFSVRFWLSCFGACAVWDAFIGHGIVVLTIYARLSGGCRKRDYFIAEVLGWVADCLRRYHHAFGKKLFYCLHIIYAKPWRFANKFEVLVYCFPEEAWGGGKEVRSFWGLVPIFLISLACEVFFFFFFFINTYT
jgi:hypothetical protein